MPAERGRLVEICQAMFDQSNIAFEPLSIAPVARGGYSGAVHLIDVERRAKPGLEGLSDRASVADGQGALCWKALLDGYGPVERFDWLTTVELYRLFQSVEFLNWLIFLDRPKPDQEVLFHNIHGILETI
jgi:hypothetical protein